MVPAHLKSTELKPVVVFGPTGSGKTTLAHQLVEACEQRGLSAAIVNLDAFQIYRGISVGTAKPTREEQGRYDYHGLDLCEPHETLDAQAFADRAWQFCHTLLNFGKLPICVGGSGLYIRAFLHGLDDLPGRDEAFRAQVRALATEQGWPACHAWLSKVDPARAAQVHPNDGVRVERALEIFHTTGRPMSELGTRTQVLTEQTLRHPCFVIGIEIQNHQAYEQAILQRTHQFLTNGWLEEVQVLLEKYQEATPHLSAFRAIGYSQVYDFITNDTGKDGISQKNIVSLATDISLKTSQYAKKQKRWYKKEKKDIFLPAYSTLQEDILKKIIPIL